MGGLPAREAALLASRPETSRHRSAFLFTLEARVAANTSKHPPRAGFTLIELMIAVAIIGILASIAIPRFRDYQLQSKASEAFVVLNTIKITQETHRAEYDCYSATVPNPPGPVTPTRRLWDDTNVAFSNPCAAVDKPFESIGSALIDRQFFFQYACEAVNPGGGVAPDYTCSAASDLDGNGTLAEYIHCTDNLNSGGCPVASHYGNTSGFPYESVRVTSERY